MISQWDQKIKLQKRRENSLDWLELTVTEPSRVKRSLTRRANAVIVLLPLPGNHFWLPSSRRVRVSQILKMAPKAADLGLLTVLSLNGIVVILDMANIGP